MKDGEESIILNNIQFVVKISAVNMQQIWFAFDSIKRIW